jgi:hypothetical protein
MDNEPLLGEPHQADVRTDVGHPARSSRRRWALIGIAVCLTLTASCAGCAIVGRRASAEGAKFAQATIVAVATAWNTGALVALASPELLQATPPDKLRTFIGFVGTRLGSVKSCQAVQNGPWQVFFGMAGLAAVTSTIATVSLKKALEESRCNSSSVAESGGLSLSTSIPIC